MSDNVGVSCCEQGNVSDSVKISSGIHTVDRDFFRYCVNLRDGIK